MPLPQLNEFQDATQNPSRCFTAPDHLNCQCELYNLGKPKLCSLNYVAAIHMYGPSGEWAAKDMKKRLGYIERRFINCNNEPYF